MVPTPKLKPPPFSVLDILANFLLSLTFNSLTMHVPFLCVYLCWEQYLFHILVLTSTGFEE